MSLSPFIKAQLSLIDLNGQGISVGELVKSSWGGGTVGEEKGIIMNKFKILKTPAWCDII